MTVAVTPRYRTYKLVTLTGWTLDQIDDTPADELDWILQIHVTEEETRAQLQREADEAAKRAR